MLLLRRTALAEVQGARCRDWDRRVGRRVTIIFGVDNDIKKMISYTQNFAAEKSYTKIRILTEQDTLPLIDDFGEKFSFHLLEKNL